MLLLATLSSCGATLVNLNIFINIYVSGTRETRGWS